MQAVEGLSIVITGGGSGLGRGAARYLAAKGARVTIGGRRREKIEAVQAEIGANCRAIVCDVTQDTDRRRLIEAALEQTDKLAQFSQRMVTRCLALKPAPLPRIPLGF